MAKKDQPGGATLSGKGRRVRVVVLPTNVALVSPPIERLRPLQAYEKFGLVQPRVTTLSDVAAQTRVWQGATPRPFQKVLPGPWAS
jgi:hypothetical protein